MRISFQQISKFKARIKRLSVIICASITCLQRPHKNNKIKKRVRPSSVGLMVCKPKCVYKIMIMRQHVLQ